MDWLREPWRKLYAREDGSFAALTYSARAAAAMLLKVCDERGRIYSQPNETPGQLAIRVLRPSTRTERQVVQKAIAELLERGPVEWTDEVGLRLLASHHHLPDGEAPPDYGHEWPRARRAALQRDGHRCRSCPSTGPLDVHHCIPLRMFRTTAEANRLENLASLCRPCHAAADAAYRADGSVFGEARN